MLRNMYTVCIVVNKFRKFAYKSADRREIARVCVCACVKVLAC